MTTPAPAPFDGVDRGQKRVIEDQSTRISPRSTRVGEGTGSGSGSGEADPAGRRRLGGAVVGTALGAGLVLLGASRVWVTTTQDLPPPLRAEVVAQTGASLAPALPALGLVALAGAGGLLATRGRARRSVGALLVAAAAAIIAVVAGELGGAVAVGWPIACLGGALVVGAAGGLAIRDGARWPVMGARYNRPSATDRPASPVDVWDAIDRGEDPTR